MRRSFLVVVGLSLFLAGCGLRPSTPVYSVSGRVVDAQGLGVAGVTLIAQGAGVVAQTGPDGSWRLDGLSGRVTIVPHTEAYEFEPASSTVTEAADGITFRLVPPSYSVSGRVVDFRGTGVAGIVVTVAGTNTQVTTGFDGSWRIDGLRGPATIVPQKLGAVFLPAERTVAAPVDGVTFQVMHPILGQSVVSREQAREFLRARMVAEEYLALVDLYYDIAPIYGIRPEVALAQAVHETGYFRFGNLVQPWQNNFAGIGATGVPSDGFTPLNGADPELVRFERGVHGAIFATPAAGVEAHIQHLYAYASTNPLPEGRKLLSPRFIYVSRGSAPTLELLSGRWATDAQYGAKIVNNVLTPMTAFRLAQ